ncbi:hypothetical protein HUE58_03690 [Candidatus Ruthia endofausta]|uniref:Uncharacterized protein n=1 Tax=Candidatus Ruthia endofausta TaxID=2738852 RepID=A0A6N0HPC2_9GAMM|nr:hypothetical protein HUE58_03690 [Candidatus Ruthia endofausta]
MYLSKDNAIGMHEVEIAIKTHTHNDLPDKVVHIKTKRKLIHVRSKNQKNYVNAI